MNSGMQYELKTNKLSAPMPKTRKSDRILIIAKRWNPIKVNTATYSHNPDRLRHYFVI